MVDRVDLPIDTTPAAPTDTPAARPQGLPEKFETMDAFVKSYTELEQKQSATGPEPEPTPADPPASKPTLTDPIKIGSKPAADLDMDAVAQEYLENNETLSDATYKSLAGRGISRAQVDTYIEGQKAIAERSINELSSLAGGREALDGVLEWAASNLSAEEIAAYNTAADSRDAAGARLALQGVLSSYRAATGTEPALVNAPGEKGGSGAGYESQAQVIAAMADPLYKTDPAYRAKVIARLAKTEQATAGMSGLDVGDVR